MKLSSRTEYAILALLELGQRYGKGFVLSRDIASTRDIPESFIERILLTLRNGGVIVSVRGAKGGHYLAKDPGKISVREVIEMFEGSLAPIDCVNERISSISASCSVEGSCVLKDLWQKMYDAMLASIENITIKDLITQEGTQKEGAMYYI
ncbi:MAG: Rrf2 family transcriptional regulator [Candidatus Scalindua sediminis]|jgi:Rrf2 family protein|nr:Rrf2 family transcriptional regulator [Candidatus Scalindua sediminis]